LIWRNGSDGHWEERDDEASLGEDEHSGTAGTYRLLEKGDKVALEARNLAFIFAQKIQKRIESEVRVDQRGEVTVYLGRTDEADTPSRNGVKEAAGRLQP
jgi:hypothetical protein